MWCSSINGVCASSYDWGCGGVNRLSKRDKIFLTYFPVGHVVANGCLWSMSKWVCPKWVQYVQMEIGSKWVLLLLLGPKIPRQMVLLCWCWDLPSPEQSNTYPTYALPPPAVTLVDWEICFGKHPIPSCNNMQELIDFLLQSRNQRCCFLKEWYSRQGM